MSPCSYKLLGECLTRVAGQTGHAIFGFAEFLTALALLVLVFSSSDFLYHFRISVAALPLRWISFVAAIGIGGGTLLTDMWFAERWYSLPWGVSQTLLQGIFGGLFLLTVLMWIWVAYMRPPIFSRWNYKRFYHGVFRTIVRGSDNQLASLAAELTRSAESLVRLWRPKPSNETNAPTRADAAAYANDTILLLGNRKLCRHVVASAPITAIVLMQEVSKQKKYAIPLGGFAKNVTTEALRNRDSILFHEDTYGADVLGRVQPFSKAMFGDYYLVEGVGSHMDSPLDIDWQLAWEMDGPQFETYCRITLLTFKNYIETGSYHSHSYALYRAFGIIKGAGRELYKLNNQPLDATDSKPAQRLRAAVSFVDESITFLGEQTDLEFGALRIPRKGTAGHRATIFDYLAELMFELLFDASSVTSPPDNAWWIQHNSLWARLFGFRQNSAAWNVIRFKFCRLVYEEIKALETFPNFKGARVLGLCLNVLGFSLPLRNRRDRGEFPIRKAVLCWTRRNYLRLAEVHPPVAASCLSGGITFDPENKRLVKIYAQGLRLEPSREYLCLDTAADQSSVTAV